MLISLQDALKRAKDNGATENPGMVISVHLYPFWISSILNFFYKKGCVDIFVNFGEIEDGRLIQRGSSTWTVK